MTIDSAKKEDLEGIVDLHLSAFSGLFASELGRKFLLEFYKVILSSNDGICYVARKDSEIEGFICGVVSEDPFAFSFKAKSFYYIIKRLIFFPKSAVNLLRFIKKGILTKDIEPKVELVSIVVSKEHRREGIGKILVEKFFSLLVEKGATKVKVFTDTKFSRGKAFYENLGFTLIKKMDLFGIEMRCYTKDLSA